MVIWRGRTSQGGWIHIYQQPANHRTVANPPKQLENNLFWAFLRDSKPTHDTGGNQSIGCVISIWEGLTFMSFMMIWKSPPKALHSFSIPASILPPQKHTRSGDT